MSFTYFERDFITDYFEKHTVSLEEMPKYLGPNVYDFLKQNNNLSTIADRIRFSEQNKLRPYDQVMITKFLTPEFSCTNAIEEICGCLTGPYIVFIDFHFIFSGTQTDDEEFLKLQTASKASAMNENFKITTSAEYDRLVNEFKGKTYADILNDSWRNCVKIFKSISHFFVNNRCDCLKTFCRF